MRVVLRLTILVLLCLLPGAAGAQDTATLVGNVVDAHGNAIQGAFVRLSRGGAPDVIEVTDTGGAFAFSSVPPDTYLVDAFADGNQIGTPRPVTLAAAQRATHYIVTSAPNGGTLGLTIAAIIAYVVVLLLFRYYNVTWPARMLLEAQLQSVEARLQLEVDDQQRGQIERLTAELNRIRREFLPNQVGWADRLFWSRGCEIAGWTRIHEIERQLVAYLVPAERVIERAFTAEAELRASASLEGRVLADRLRNSLKDASALAGHALEHLKQQLAQALGVIYDERDTQFLSLMELHNKAMWMAHVAVVTIAILAVCFRHEELFLFGAAGGLMSRMARVLFRQDVPTDYGASWTTLFLSPLVGAISAWFGIAMIVFLTQLDVLGEALRVISWTGPANHPVTITIAVALGFSERLFTSLLTAVERRVEAPRQVAERDPVAAPVARATEGTARTADEAVRRAVAASSAALATDAVISALDVTRGERAAFIGDPSSPWREPLRAIAGRENVLDLDIEQLKKIKPMDAVLIESLRDPTGLTAAAAVISEALSFDGRVVVVGETPAAFYDADAAAQRQANVIGPAVLHEAMTTAGLLAQEPPERIGGQDPVRWTLAFVKPAD